MATQDFIMQKRSPSNCNQPVSLENMKLISDAIKHIDFVEDQLFVKKPEPHPLSESLSCAEASLLEFIYCNSNLRLCKIADKYGRSINTVNKHLRSARLKLLQEELSHHALASYAFRKGFIKPFKPNEHVFDHLVVARDLLSQIKAEKPFKNV